MVSIARKKISVDRSRAELHPLFHEIEITRPVGEGGCRTRTRRSKAPVPAELCPTSVADFHVSTVVRPVWMAKRIAITALPSEHFFFFVLVKM